MNTSYSITTKYQVTIPKEIRQKIGLHKNDKIEFVEDSGKVYLKKAPTIKDVAKITSRKAAQFRSKPATEEEIAGARSKFIRRLWKG
jgi:AbrB family looped-hinge helix DNA binding protein